MPLNFFKRSKKTNGPAIKPAEFTKEMFSDKAMKTRQKAAIEFMQLFQNRMPLIDGYPHAGTALSIVAQLAGTSLFRAINIRDYGEEKTAVLSQEINDAFPKLLNLFLHYCKETGVDINEKSIVTDTPEKDKPIMNLEQVQAEYQTQYNKVMKKHRLDYIEGALTGMNICSMIFNYHSITNKDIDPYVAFGIVTMGVIQGAKTVPVPLDKAKAKKYKQAKYSRKPISRFVIGDLDDVIEDVNKNGGQYTKIVPDVRAKLKAENIDPKLIYIKGLESQLEAKVKRVDFVKMNLDEILGQELNNQIPIQVFLAFWLNEKAEEYGYKHEENSWVLK